MSNGIHVNGHEADREINVTAQPERISVGGTVGLTAEVPGHAPGYVPDTRYTVEWTVEGPVQLAFASPVFLRGARCRPMAVTWRDRCGVAAGHDDRPCRCVCSI